MKKIYILIIASIYYLSVQGWSGLSMTNNAIRVAAPYGRYVAYTVERNTGTLSVPLQISIITHEKKLVGTYMMSADQRSVKIIADWAGIMPEASYYIILSQQQPNGSYTRIAPQHIVSVTQTSEPRWMLGQDLKNQAALIITHNYAGEAILIIGGTIAALAALATLVPTYLYYKNQTVDMAKMRNFKKWLLTLLQEGGIEIINNNIGWNSDKYRNNVWDKYGNINRSMFFHLFHITKPFENGYEGFSRAEQKIIKQVFNNQITPDCYNKEPQYQAAEPEVRQAYETVLRNLDQLIPY